MRIYADILTTTDATPLPGHFENPEIGHCIAVILFHGPSSVGVMFPDYFKAMPLTVVAFALAMVRSFTAF